MQKKRVVLSGVVLLNLTILTSLGLGFYPHFSMQQYLDETYRQVATQSEISPDYLGEVDLFKFESALVGLGMGSNQLRLDADALEHFGAVNRTLANVSDLAARDRADYLAKMLMGHLYPEFERLRSKVATFQTRYDALVGAADFEFNANGVEQIENLQHSLFESSEIATIFGAFNQELRRYSQTQRAMFDVRRASGRQPVSANDNDAATEN